MGWGWLCCAITEKFVASFPQILGFFFSLEQKEGPLQNSHFATVPFLEPDDLHYGHTAKP